MVAWPSRWRSERAKSEVRAVYFFRLTHKAEFGAPRASDADRVAFLRHHAAAARPARSADDCREEMGWPAVDGRDDIGPPNTSSAVVADCKSERAAPILRCVA
jgi:hypothetical protein